MASLKRILIKHANELHRDYLRCTQNSTDLCFTESYRNVAKIVAQLTPQMLGVGAHTFSGLKGYTYQEIYEHPSHDISLGVFILPKGFMIPIHDHPGMWVLSKILYGRAIRKTFTLNPEFRALQWVYPNRVHIQKDKDALQNPPLVMATKTGENQVHAGMLDFVKPVYNNLHEFVAQEDFIFFNCFVPHYDNVKRFSNFFEEVGAPVGTQQQLRMLPNVNYFYKSYQKFIAPFNTNCEFCAEAPQHQEDQHYHQAQKSMSNNKNTLHDQNAAQTLQSVSSVAI